MLTTVWILVLLPLLGWLYLRWTRVRTYWARLGVPFDPPHPIMGSLTFLQKKNPGLWFIEIYRKCNAPYFGIWLFWRPTLVINDPEIAKRMVVKDSDVFRDRFLGSGSSDPIGGMNIFTVNDPTWSWVRRRITPVFTSSRLRGMQLLLTTKSKELVDRLKRETAEGKKIDIRQVYTDYSTDLIGITSFGIDSDSTATGDSALRRITRDFQKFSVLRGIAWTFIFFFPSMVSVFGFTFFPKKATEYFRRIFHTVVQQRGGWNAEAGQKDLLDCLIKFKQESINKNEEIADDLLVAQAAIMVQGGFETTSSSLTYATYELAHQPELQEKLYAELKALQDKHGVLDTTVLSEAPYLNAVMKETLRKYPAMGWLDRITTREYKVDDKLTIPAGTPTYINVIGMQRDPKYYPDPDKFDPDRFLPENEQNINPFTYMPFGEGPRSCIGKRFAQVSMRSALAGITLNFKYRPLPNAKTPNQIEFEKKGLFFMPGEILNLEYIPRN